MSWIPGFAADHVFWATFAIHEADGATSKLYACLAYSLTMLYASFSRTAGGTNGNVCGTRTGQIVYKLLAGVDETPKYAGIWYTPDGRLSPVILPPSFSHHPGRALTGYACLLTFG